MTKLKRSEEKFILLFENAPIGMAMISHDTGEFLEVNDALLSYVGYTKEEFLTMSFWDITPKAYDFQEQSQIEQLNQTGRFGPNEKEYIRKDGTKVPIRLSGFKMIDVDEREVVWGIIEDISLEKSLEHERKKLKKISITDHLTGLYNRPKIEKTMRKEVSRHNRSRMPLSIIMMDIDHFKSINDTYGHAIGDEVLIEIATILKAYTRKTDTVGRWGGEEFVIICPDTDSTGAIRLAEKIRKAIEEQTIKAHGKTSASFGVTQFTDKDDPSSLLVRADKALYDAKKRGRNKIVCF